MIMRLYLDNLLVARATEDKAVSKLGAIFSYNYTGLGDSYL